MSMSQGYPAEINIDSYLSTRGLELMSENGANFLGDFKQFLWGVLNSFDWAGALGVWLPSTTTYNVRGGKYKYRGEVKTYTPGSAVNPTDNDTTYIWLDPAANSISAAIDGTGWPSTEHIKLAEIDVDSDGAITAVRDLRGQTFMDYQTAATVSGITTGQVTAKVIASAQLEALLDTSTNNLFAVKAGDIILGVKLFVETAAGGACAVTIGTDADVDGTAADTDSLLKAGDANTAGVYASDDPALTYQGDDLKSGAFAADDDGYITITSSTDQSSSSFVGKAVLLYIPA